MMIYITVNDSLDDSIYFCLDKHNQAKAKVT